MGSTYGKLEAHVLSRNIITTSRIALGTAIVVEFYSNAKSIDHYRLNKNDNFVSILIHVCHIKHSITIFDVLSSKISDFLDICFRKIVLAFWGQN